MKVGIGYCDDPDTTAAGQHVITEALKQSGRTDPCDLVLLFSTAYHDAAVLQKSVISIIGPSIPIYGGGTAGVITNEFFGYAGHQVGVACIWLDGVQCNVLTEGRLKDGEEETGIQLGKRLAATGTKTDSPILLFYDAVDTTEGFRLLMATPLLAGIDKGLGFLPNLSGVGMVGNHAFTPMDQWIGHSIGKSQAIALAFSGNLRMDSIILHGCRPSTQYFTVTKADSNVILEINGEPAIPFIAQLLDSSIAPEQYPFFLVFGINHGEPWSDYDEKNYASRLCFGIDKERNGIVMFEPDMVAGTEFQLMYRSLDMDYIKPKIDKAFQDLGDREAVFCMYINCAGRSAGYAGLDLEDAVFIQQAVAGRVPVLGLYSGVEIAPIGGRPRGLDLTGVFCLFSQSKGESDVSQTVEEDVLWASDTIPSQSRGNSLEAITHICDQNAAKILALDTVAVALRLELEQRRRGFSLLAELAMSSQQGGGLENVLIPASQRINAALMMQRTVVLKKNEKGLFSPVVMQGYSAQEKAALAGQAIDIPEELLMPAIVTGADSDQRLQPIRSLLGLPYFVSSPIVPHNEVFGILFVGRLVEAPPFLLRLNQHDAETIQAICAFLASVLTKQRLAAAEEQNRLMVDKVPIGCLFWDENGTLIDCNQEALLLFDAPDKERFLEQFISIVPNESMQVSHSTEFIQEIKKAFITGSAKFHWTYTTAKGEYIPTEITLIRVPTGENYYLVGYIEDMRNEDAAAKYIETKNQFLASVNHELRTPLNVIQSMARIASAVPELSQNQQEIVSRGMQSVELLTSAIETILDFSSLDSGQLSLTHARFSIKELMKDIATFVQNDVEEKTLYFRVSIDPHIPEFVLGDFARLRQALLNIVNNAVKFTDTGGVEVYVFSEQNDRVGEVALVFAVKDTGIGIHEENPVKDDVFRPFFTKDMSYSRKHSGFGMGLPVSNSLITLMGGKIAYQKGLEGGSIFNVHISLPIAREQTVERNDVEDRMELASLRGMRVLVAEDNKINQMIMSELLTSKGIDVTFAENGIKVLERLSDSVFDLILMDVQMPEMDGLTATSHIRSDIRYADLPILAMTANASADHQKESLRAGMNAHLTKPVNVEELYRALIKWRK